MKLLILTTALFVTLSKIDGFVHQVIRRRITDFGHPLRSSYLDNLNGDEPASATSSSSSPVASTTNYSYRLELLELSADTLRGTQSSKASAEQYTELVEELEALGQTSPALAPGNYQLIYSTSPEGLFRSSPFFLTARAVCKSEDDAAKFSWFCQMHRKALAISRIAGVRQIIKEDGEVVNEFNTIVGAVPFLSDFTPFRYSGGLPLEIEGCITSTGTLTASEVEGELEVGMKTVQIRGSNIPWLRSFLDSDSAVLDTKQLGDFIESVNKDYNNPKAVLKVVYAGAGDGVRIVRDADGIDYVYAMSSEAVELTDFKGRDADLGVLELLEGLNENVFKVFM